MSKEDRKIWLVNEQGQKFFIYETEKCDMEKELNETIQRLQKRIEELEEERKLLNTEYVDNISEGQYIGINKLQYKEYLYLKSNSIPKAKVEEILKKEELPNTIVGGRRNSKTLNYGKKLGRIELCKELLKNEGE